ncbi:hypothetical protein O6H91_10G086900 [Diphasiastrum complanatum]|uniref:Uncharacterized protein n=1 Tax=Diphasiastrum complanatum TaxID=34168 RepID=A0ACC2CJ84_DIPCM|nr:hypothetical protein O6H91_10G086900 [Diphasiastrum complanatum]
MDSTDEVMLPGFRFHPTDEELVGFYLRRKVQHKPLAVEVITQLDIYKFDPWDLPKMATVGEKEWYFFCPRDRKYRNSTRPNRVTGAGFWKATGTDRPIYSADGVHCIGLKKSLVFYKGRSAKGIKTDWMMHEFRLPQSSNFSAMSGAQKRLECQQYEAECWAVCRIFKKTPLMQRSMPHPWIVDSQEQHQTLITNYSYGQYSAANSAESRDVTLEATADQDSQAEGRTRKNNNSNTKSYPFSSPANDEACYPNPTNAAMPVPQSRVVESSHHFFKDFSCFSNAAGPHVTSSSQSPCNSSHSQGDGLSLHSSSWDLSLLFNLSASPAR